MHADQAEHLAGLPAPVPDDLPGPAAAAARDRRGRTTASAPACTTRWPGGGGCRAPERTVAAAGDLLERGWIEEGFADAAQSAQYRRWARGLVEAYVAGLDPASEPLGVERTVATRTDLIAVSGRIDRLDERRTAPRRPGELVVVDYKTGRHLLTVDDARTSLPLALYALAAAAGDARPCRRVELHHLPTGRVLAWEHTAESLARQLRRAEDIAAECAAADELFRGAPPGEPSPGSPGRPDDRVDQIFPPRPGSWCGWCDYRAHCPEGSAASEAAAMDALGRTRVRMPQPTAEPVRRPAPGRRAVCPPRIVRAVPPARGPDAAARCSSAASPERRERAGRGLGRLDRRGVPAPGMQTRCAPSRLAIRSWTAGGHASSFSP